MNRYKLKKTAVPYLFLLPFMVIYLLFFLWPALYSLGLSFFKYSGYGAAKWVGLQNYKNLFHYDTMGEYSLLLYFQLYSDDGVLVSACSGR